MNAWETYREILAPAAAVTADPDWVALQFAVPPTAPPNQMALSFPRAPAGYNALPAKNLRLCVLPLRANKSVIAPAGTLTVQVLELVPGPSVPVLVVVAASLVLDLGQDEDAGLSAFGTGNYVFRAVSSAALPAGTESLLVQHKVIV